MHPSLDFLVRGLSRTPLRWLYGLASGVHLLAFHVLHYREHVIVPQLEKVFPSATVAERRRIHRDFVRHYCDVMVEILKAFSMPAEALRSRVQLDNPELARRYLDVGQSVMLVTSHLCNWEWLLHGVTLNLPYPVDAAYKPITDPAGERLMLAMRTRFGAHLVAAKDLLTDMLKRRAVVRIIAINADQVPSPAERHQWLEFLGQDTAFYVGAEQIARSLRLPMIYIGMRRVRRGHYACDFRPLWDGREAVEPGQITQRYARACEADVRRSPADWLWTYRRWRYSKPLYGGDSTDPL